jgi:hypothetical protein
MAQNPYATPTTISINLNDAAFLSAILAKWMKAEDMETAYLQDLALHLTPKAGC